MSDQAAPVAVPTEAAPQHGQGAKAYDLHKCAMDAYAAAEKLATEMGKSGAPDKVIAAVSKSADGFQQLARTFAGLDLAPSPAGQAGPPQESAPRETMATATDGLAQAARKPAY